MTLDVNQLAPYMMPDYVSVDPPYEFVYPIPSGDAFKTVSAAVFYVFSRLAPGETVPRDEVPGGIVYNLKLGDLAFQLFVLHVSNHAACLRIHRLCPSSALKLEERGLIWRPRDPEKPHLRGVAALIAAIHEAIVDLLRYSIDAGKEIIPPAPSATDIHAVFLWQEIYHPKMVDKELADKIGISHQQLRNKRSKFDQQKRKLTKRQAEARTPRGKPKH